MKWTYPMILSALEITAIRRSGVLGHRLGKWTDAKRKLGRSARKAECVICGKQVLLTPLGYGNARNKLAQDVPGIRGDAVFEPCVEPGDHNETVLVR